MIVLDENIVDGQRLLLESWNIAARQVGLDVGRKGVKDEEIVVMLRRRFLHHPEFSTHANRAGKIVRIASSGIACWQLRRQQEMFVPWETRA